MKTLKTLCFVLCFALLFGCTVTSSDRTLSKSRVAVIAKSTESTFWKAVRSGVNTAASEYNLDYTFEGPLSEEDYAEQNNMISDAIENGVDAIVLSAIDYSRSVQEVERAVAAGISVIVIDSDVDSDKVRVRIGTDNYKAGQAAAKEILRCNTPYIRIGLVGFDVHSENGQQREKGFEDTVTKDARAKIVETANSPSIPEKAQETTREMLKRHPDINAIVTFNEITTLGVGHAIEELEATDTINVVGFDNNVVSVGMLESGEMDALIVQNPFAIGYLSMENAAQLIAGKTIQKKWIHTEVRIITRENMYSEENQRFLFSFTENA